MRATSNECETNMEYTSVRGWSKDCHLMCFQHAVALFKQHCVVTGHPLSTDVLPNVMQAVRSEPVAATAAIYCTLAAAFYADADGA